MMRTMLEFCHPDEVMTLNRDDLYVPSTSHSHNFVELEYVLSGSGIQIVNGKEYHIQRGDVIVMELGSCHSYYSTDRLVIINCILRPDIYEREKQRILSADPAPDGVFLPDFIRLSGRHFMEIENYLLNLEQEIEQKPIGYRLLCENYLAAILLILYRNVRENVQERDNDIRKNIISYIDLNYTHVTLSEIAAHFGYNPSYFSKLFKRTMQENLFEYVARKKMDEALRLVSSTNYSIESICHQLGYSDKKQFYKLFKQKTGVTPNQFRKAHPLS